MFKAGLDIAMAEHPNTFSMKTFVAITGASRGLGRSIALQFSVKLPPNSVISIMARNKEDLESVKSEVSLVNPSINILVQQYDQGNVENTSYFKDIFTDILQDNDISENDFEQYIIVHNCATIGDVAKGSLELSDSASVRKYFDINLTGMILLNTSFFQTFSDSTKVRVVVNMTSAFVKTPLASFHQYSAVKAARDMFMRVLAVEEPSLRILTFAPGVADTDLVKETERLSGNKSVVDNLKKWRADGTMTLPGTPIAKMIEILEENKFDNAGYVE